MKHYRWLHWQRGQVIVRHSLIFVDSPLLVIYCKKIKSLAMVCGWIERLRSRLHIKSMLKNGDHEEIDWPTLWFLSSSRLSLKIGRNWMRNTELEVRICYAQSERLDIKIRKFIKIKKLFLIMLPIWILPHWWMYGLSLVFFKMKHSSTCLRSINFLLATFCLVR